MSFSRDRGPVKRRIQSNRNLLYYYKQLGEPAQQLVARLDEMASELGRIPSHSETIRILADSRVK
jgi:hypothetical protein